MASKPLSAKVVLDLSVGAISKGADASREIERITGSAAHKGFSQGLKKGSKQASGELEKAWKQLFKAGMREEGKTLRKAYKDAARIQKQSSEELVEVREGLQKSISEDERRTLLRRKEALEREIKRQSKAQKGLINMANKDAERRMELIEQHEARISKSRLEAAQEAGEGFSDVIGKALSGSFDAGGLAESLAKGLSGALGAGAGAAGASGAGGAATALTTAAGTLAAVAAPLAAVVGLIAAAYGQTKDLNKAFLDAGSAADMLGANAESINLLNVEYGALNVRLKMLRRVAVDAAYDFRMSKEEVAGYITAMNEAGLTVGEFRSVVKGSTNDMQAYQDVTRTAIMASQGLGISASEAGDFMSKTTRDMGYGLENIQGAFGMIFSEARKAGMSTKDFFSNINEASSGMALYNFRLGDTVGLFTDLVDILGEDLAKQQLKLEGTFRQQGMQGRVKSTMLMGTGRASGIAKADAMAQGKEFAKAFGDIPGLGNLGDEETLKKLGGMSGEEFRKIYGQVEGADAKRQLVSIQELSKGMSGGLMDVSASLGALSKSGELAAQLSQGAALTGGKALADVEGMQLMMLQEALGISGDQWDTLKRLDLGLRDEFQKMQASAVEGDEILGLTFEQALAGGMLSQSQTLEEGAEAQYSLMERAAQDSLMETRSMSATLSNVVASLLENIWISLEHLVTMFGQLPGMGSSDVAARRDSTKREAAQQALLEQLGGQLAGKRGDLTSEGDPGRRAALKEEIKSLEGQIGKARDQISTEKEVRKRLAMGEGGVAARSGAATASFSEKFGMDPRAFVNSMSFAARGKLGIGAQEGLSVGAPMGSSYGGQTANSHMGQKMVESLLKGDLMSGAISPEKARELGFEVAIAPIQELTQEQIETITAEAELTRQKSGADALTQEKATEETTKSVDALTQFLKKEQLAKITGATGLSAEKISEMMSGGEAGQGGILAKLRAAVASSAISEVQGRELAGYLDLVYDSKVNDFIYRGDGTRGHITPIDKKDEFFGAKPGGALDQGGRGVQIHINGGDEAKVYSIVKRVLQETGYDRLKSY